VWNEIPCSIRFTVGSLGHRFELIRSEAKVTITPASIAVLATEKCAEPGRNEIDSCGPALLRRAETPLIAPTQCFGREFALAKSANHVETESETRRRSAHRHARASGVEAWGWTSMSTSWRSGCDAETSPLVRHDRAPATAFTG